MIRAKKSLSQNFIIDKNICRKIAQQTSIKKKIVLEIGPGYGFMTDFLLEQKPEKIILIEKDPNLVKFLQNKYKGINKIIVILQDILNINLSEYKNIIIVSNLPYNISTKIILHLFKFNKNINEMVLMIQKEVAYKFDYNLPNMNKYKFLTSLISTFTRNFEVSSKVFIPKPKVTSSVVSFKFNKKMFNHNKANKFSKLIFRNIRKKISNNLKLDYKNQLLNKRVSELSIDELLNIYNLF